MSEEIMEFSHFFYRQSYTGYMKYFQPYYFTLMVTWDEDTAMFLGKSVGMFSIHDFSRSYLREKKKSETWKQKMIG